MANRDGAGSTVLVETGSREKNREPRAACGGCGRVRRGCSRISWWPSSAGSSVGGGGGDLSLPPAPHTGRAGVGTCLAFVGVNGVSFNDL